LLGKPRTSSCNVVFAFSCHNTIVQIEINKIILKTLSGKRWRIEGKDGAVAILDLHPSTLRARMHKLGIVGPETKE